MVRNIIKNSTGTTIKAGSAVYLSGYDAENFVSTVALADNRYSSKMPAAGITEIDIANGETGQIRTTGVMYGFDTRNKSINQKIYVGENGKITFSDPINTNPNAVSQCIGVVASIAGPTNGQIQLLPLEISTLATHDNLPDLDTTSHSKYTLTDGTRGFTGPIKGIDPSEGAHLATKNYVDRFITEGAWKNPIEDKDLSTPPVAPRKGDRYIIGAGGSGDWASKDDWVAEWDGNSWIFIRPYEGFAAFVKDEDVVYIWSGSAWAALSGSGGGLSGGGVSGQVAYWSGTSSLTGEAAFVYDAATNRLGIGGNPQTSLHILSTDPKVRLTDTDTNADFLISASSSIGGAIISADEYNEVAGSYLGLRVDGAYAIFIDQNQRVGIGTTSPSYTLDVSSPVINGDDLFSAQILDGCSNGYDGGLLLSSFQPRLVMNDRSTSAKFFDFRVSTNNLYISAGSNTDLFARTASNIVTIDGANSRVGIGETAPTLPLQVKDSVSLPLKLQRTGTVAGQACGVRFTTDQGDTDLFGVGSNVLYTTAKLGIGDNTPSYSLEVVGDIRVIGEAYMLGSINTGTATTSDLYISTSTGQLGLNSSSIKVKQKIEYDIDTSWIYDLRPVTFEYKKSPNELQYGLIAEEAALVSPYIVDFENIEEEVEDYYVPNSNETVIPKNLGRVDENGNRKKSMVKVTKSDIPMGISYSRLISPMLKELQNLKAVVDTLTQQNADLLNRLEALENPPQ